MNYDDKIWYVVLILAHEKALKSTEIDKNILNWHNTEIIQFLRNTPVFTIEAIPRHSPGTVSKPYT